LVHKHRFLQEVDRQDRLTTSITTSGVEESEQIVHWSRIKPATVAILSGTRDGPKGHIIQMPISVPFSLKAVVPTGKQEPPGKKKESPGDLRIVYSYPDAVFRV